MLPEFCVPITATAPIIATMATITSITTARMLLLLSDILLEYDARGRLVETARSEHAAFW